MDQAKRHAAREGDATNAQSGFASEHADLFLQVLRSVGEGVIVADADGKFVVFNTAAEEIIGIGPQAVSPSEWSGRYGVYLPDAKTPYPAEALPLARALRG